ncbi:MAG: hypothetical protein M3209_00070 [Acidobacteriota bacterium]|nr:hypothetical protein [Acidobacteriota bacterium]
MKIKNETGGIQICSSCNGNDFKPLGENKFECRTCGEPITAPSNNEQENKN